jgi:hypothetical protein
MNQSSSLSILGGAQPYTLIVEPWATEYVVQPSDRCHLVVSHNSEAPAVAVEPLVEGNLIILVEASGATYEFWRNGVKEAEMPVPTL